MPIRLVLSMFVGATLLLWPSPVAAGAPVLDPPVAGPILARFHAPTTYGAGHRGVDLGTPHGSTVRASAAGRVTFAGSVVGSLWVTVDHGFIRTTVGPLSVVGVDHGDRVVRGSILGRSGTAHGRAAVHWSARRGDRYVDPLLVGRGRASLVADGSSGPARGVAAATSPRGSSSTGPTATVRRFAAVAKPARVR